MPDVESLRSDAAVGAHRPRVSFNRDVHVKRIGPRGVQASPNGSPKAPVRKQRLGQVSDEVLAREAARVVRQADSVHCKALPPPAPDKFLTLPLRRKNTQNGNSVGRSNSLKTNNKPRTPRTSIFNIFKKPDVTPNENKPNSRPIGRSKSDVTDRRHEVTQFRKRTGSESEEYLESVQDKKKPLSPIIETSPKEDYFGKNNPLDVVDGTVKSQESKEEQTKKTKSKDNSNSSAKKLKVDKTKSVDVIKNNKINDKENINPESVDVTDGELRIASNVADTIKETINILGSSAVQEKPEDMIHSSQKPTEKLPLTKGHTVDHLVKKLSNEKPSTLPYTNLLITPGAVQHNNNQPFSYTRPSISPDPNMYNHHSDHSVSRLPGQIIYAQVVCNNDSNGMNKQTVHTSFTKPRNNSDEDEGLGYEESSKGIADRFSQIEDPYKSLSDYNTDLDLPITPTLREYRTETYNNKETYTHSYDDFNRKRGDLIDLPARGMADGMDSKRKESLTEPHMYNTDLSHRRDLLQSRINSRKLADSSLESEERLFKRYSPTRDLHSPLTTKYVTETKSQYYRDGNKSPVGFTEKIVSKTHIDDDGIPYTTKSHLRSDWPHRDLDIDRKLFLDSHLNSEEYGNMYTPKFNYADSNEPRSLDSQISDYIPSPEHLHRSTLHHEEKDIVHTNKYSKDDRFAQNRDHYRSNPEIVPRKDYVLDSLQSPGRPETYHNSLRRQNKEERVKSRYNYGDMLESTPKTSRIVENGFGHFDTERERKDRLVDSGIENDYRKDSNGEIDLKNSSDRRYMHKRNHIGNESDEEVNSSFRLMNGRRHTENNVNYVRDVDLDLYDYRFRNGDSYLNKEGRYRSDDDYKSFEGKEYKKGKREDYVHRERSIDDGSLYDPRIDKISDKKSSNTKTKDAKLEKKPPKEDKKLSGLEKVKQLFSRDSTKKQKKEKVESMVKEEDLRARYTEYKGSAENLEDQIEERVEKKRGTFKSSRDSRIDELPDYGSRRRLSTPSASPSPPRRDVRKETVPVHATSAKPHGGSWFKSLDRLARRGKTRPKNKDTATDNDSNPGKYPQSSSSGSRNASRLASRQSSSPLPGVTSTPQKNLRFFGDTDLESNASISKHKSNLKTRPALSRSNGKHYASTQVLSSVDKERKRVSSMSSLHNDQTDGRQNLLLNSYNQEKFSNRNLHNISEIHSQSETEVEEPSVKKGFSRYRYGREQVKPAGDSGDFRIVKKPPMSPLKENRKNDMKYGSNARDTLSKMRKSKSDLSDGDFRRKRAEMIGGNSSVESSTEGDSSQQSQHSVVYLHAATVGDIPGPRRRNRRSASREELSSVTSSRLQPQVKTISRSISVLAPWKPRHIREGYDINYSQMQNNLTNVRSKTKPRNASISSQDSSQKMKTRNGQTDNHTMSRRAKYENHEKKSSNNTLYRKNKDRTSHENLSERKHSKTKSGTMDRNKIDKHTRSGSAEALSASGRMRDEKISRSISMPRDPSKSAGWFKMSKKSKK